MYVYKYDSNNNWPTSLNQLKDRGILSTTPVSTSYKYEGKVN